MKEIGERTVGFVRAALRSALFMAVAFAVMALGVAATTSGAIAQQGYWRLTKVLPAVIKNVPPDPHNGGLADSVKDTHDNYIEDTVSTYKDQITTRTYFSPPPLSLFPSQKVTFHASIRRVQNTFKGSSHGTGVFYNFGVGKDPYTPSVMLSGSLDASSPSSVRDLTGVMKVPDNAGTAAQQAEKSLWLRIQVNPPLYDKLYQYAWVAGPPPANMKTTDIDLPVASGPTPPDSSGVSSQPKTVSACPINATQLTLQACRLSAAQGATIRVPIYLLKSADLANLNFDLKYDSAVAKPAGKAERGPLLGGQVLFESNVGQTGVARIGFAGSTGVSGSGIVAYVPFTVVGAPGSRTAIALQDTAANTIANARPSFALLAGEIAVVQGQTPSDGGASVNPNPKPDSQSKPPVVSNPPVSKKVFTALDALKALRMSVGLLQSDPSYDLDANGQITSNDARLILGRVVGR